MASPEPSTDKDIDDVRRDALRCVVIGATGVGKSTLCNMLAGVANYWQYLKGLVTSRLPSFMAKKSSKSVTVNPQEEMLVFEDGTSVRLIDTPGYFDTTNLDVKAKFKEALELVSPGPDVVLLVIRAGRFTPEVVEGVEKMKKIFSDEVLNYMGIVFSDPGDEDEFDEFIKGIEEPVCNKLIRDCENRYVGVEKFRDVKSPENKEQMQKLLEMMKGIRKKNNNKYYSCDLLKMVTKKDTAAVDTHIEETSGGCFASDSVVRVQDNIGRITLKSLEDLAVGDLVESYDSESNSVTYSPIYYIIYQEDNDRKSVLRELFYHGSDGKDRSLRLQGKHLVYATIHTPSASLDTRIPPPTPIMSEKVNVGDVLWIIDDDSGELCPRLVTKIGELVANVRHPMTMNHTIIVDGVLASVHMHNEWFLRQATVPLRLLYKISPRLSGLWIPKKAVQGWDYVERYLLE